MLATEQATIPVWAMALQNRGATRTNRDQHCSCFPLPAAIAEHPQFAL
jgi:hypothetical protein